MREFIMAALPWVTIGLLLAIFFARSAVKRKKEEAADDYGLIGMCLGMSFGVALGSLFGEYSALGMPVGMLIGLLVGSLIPKKDGGKEEEGK